jgi:hypothetical protein
MALAGPPVDGETRGEVEPHTGPVLRWTSEIPIEDEPADIVTFVRRNQRILATTGCLR